MGSAARGSWCGTRVRAFRRADRERVFRRFVRLEASRNTAGNGLGLALVEAVAAVHGGTVELAENAASRGGAGLKVTLLLPAG